MTTAQVWTDGSITKNPGGKMGWAARIELHDVASLSKPLIIHTWGYKDAQAGNTNQVAEMKAIRASLLVLQDHLGVTGITITSDSQWCIKQLRKEWKRNTYLAEWAEIELLLARYNPKPDDFIHTRGHMRTGDWRNEECDKLAEAAVKGEVTSEILSKIIEAGTKLYESSIPGDPGSTGNPVV